MKTILSSLFTIIFVLFGLTESLRALSSTTLETASGDFGQNLSFDTGWDSPQTLELHQDNWPPERFSVSDMRDGPNVYTYVRQNPWTMFDPLGLVGSMPGYAGIMAYRHTGDERHLEMGMQEIEDFKVGMNAQIELVQRLFTDPKSLANKETMTSLALAYIQGGGKKRKGGKGRSESFTTKTKGNQSKPQKTQKDTQEQSKAEVEKFNGKQDTTSSSDREAYRKAKDQNGVPRSQQPDETTFVPDKNTGDPLKVDTFTNSEGKKVQVRRDKPVTYPDGGTQGEHYNAGEKDKKLKQHHNIESSSDGS